MQSPENTPAPNADQLRTRVFGALAIAGVVLVSPLVLAVLFYFVGVAANNFHAMIAAITGAY